MQGVGEGARGSSLQPAVPTASRQTPPGPQPAQATAAWPCCVSFLFTVNNVLYLKNLGLADLRSRFPPTKSRWAVGLCPAEGKEVLEGPRLC